MQATGAQKPKIGLYRPTWRDKIEIVLSDCFKPIGEGMTSFGDNTVFSYCNSVQRNGTRIYHWFLLLDLPAY